LPYQVKAMRKLLLLTIIPLFISCINEETFDDTPMGNFQALWTIMDEHYCFFDYKAKAYGLDWDSIYTVYYAQINDDMTNDQLAEVLGNMLDELRDGHVNLYYSGNLMRYWNWYEDYESNFSSDLQNDYLGTDYKIGSGLKNKILDDNVGYLACNTFESDFGNSNLNAMLKYLSLCNGIIIDIRDNTGGLLTAAQTLASRFTNNKIKVGYIQHKTGKGHNDFSDLETQYLESADNSLRWQKKVVVLTNRKVFSAANEFVKEIRCCPNSTIVGDSTGGGSGLPFCSELPNGWNIRFSACPIYDTNKNNTEFGIAPDYQVSLNEYNRLQGFDTIIEYARELINKE